jgi:hypothetical protein
MPAIQLFAAYVCIKLHETMSLPAVVFFILIYMDANILLTAATTPASRIHIKSNNLLKKWMSRKDVMKCAILRKTLKACPPLKIRFGSNWVDQSTPLVFQDTSARQTVSFVLI